MSLVRFLPAWFHGIADYAVGIAPHRRRAGRRRLRRRSRDGRRSSARSCSSSACSPATRSASPKVLPFTVHSAGDYLAAALLLAGAVRTRLQRTPTVDSPRSTSSPASPSLAVSLITNYQYSPERRVEPDQTVALTDVVARGLGTAAEGASAADHV